MIHSKSISMVIGILCKLVAESGSIHKVTLNFINVIISLRRQLKRKTRQ